MRKFIAFTLSLIVIISLNACTSNQNNLQSDNTTIQLSPKEQYDNANSLISEKKYREAIEILENIDYENSQELKKSSSYCYACELFNEQEFSLAYNYFEKSDGCLDANEKMIMSAYYEGVKLVKNDQHWKSIDWFRKTLNDDRYKTAAEKHIIQITTDLLGAAWFGSYTNSSGTTLQVEFKYFASKDNLYIAHTDTSNGYRFIASITGSLDVGAEKCKYYHSETIFSGSWDVIEVSFSSSNRMYVSCNSSTIGKAIEGYYTSKSACSSYRINGVDYPTVNVPTIDATGKLTDAAENTDTSVNNSPENGNGDDIEVVYKSRSSSTAGCKIKLDDHSLLYDKNQIIINATVESINYDIANPGPGIHLTFYDENGKVLTGRGVERALTSNQNIGSKIEFSFDFPEGTKKIVICDYAILDQKGK